MLRLLFPALLPSWRFFASVGPSPRIEYALLNDVDGTPCWQPLVSERERVTWRESFLALFWNPERNEALFLVTCCERLLADGPERSAFWQREILSRVLRKAAVATSTTHILYRIVVLERHGTRVEAETAFLSRAHEVAPLSPNAHSA
jgi:hypothetical protein